jgi:hypothetical protein
MITSRFIFNILYLSLDDDTLDQNIGRQLSFLTEQPYEYTSAGFFVGFSHEAGIEKFRTKDDTIRLNGVVIRSQEIEPGAEAMVVINNGIIDYLEVWSHSGNTRPGS